MSIRHFLSNLIGNSGAAPAGTASAAVTTPVASVPREVPREAYYPPQDPGLPVIEPECLLEAVSGTIRRLRELTASDRAQFEASYLQPIQNLAHLVHLLPASASEHYSGSGGLFRLCVDLAFYALQSADGKIFTPNDSVEQRHKNEPRWRYATFQAALSCQVFRSLTLMTVTNDRGEEWPRFTTTLYEWLRQSCATRYYVKWHQPSNITGAEGAAVLAKVTPKERMDWLAQGDVQIVRDMHQVAMGASHQSDSIMANVMSTIVRRVIDMDESTRRSRYGLLTVGMHAEPYVLDAMRDAIESGIWKVNQVGSPVWYGSDGLFIEWPAGHSAVLAHFERNGLRGMPRSSISLAEILGKSGVVISAESGLWVRDVMVPMEQGGPRTRRSTALRFVDAQAIFGHMPVEHTKWPYGAELVTAEMQAGVNLQPEKPDRPSKATPAMQPAPDVPQTEPKDQPARASQNQAAPETPSVPSTAPAPTAAAEHPAPVDPDTGEIIYADLIKPEARRWIKSSDIAETVGQMIQLQKAHRGEIVKGFSYGVALSVDWIGDQSPTDITQFVKVFETNRWLGRPSGAKNEAVKLHEIQFDDALKKAIVLSVQGAQTLGFDTGARK